MIALLGGDWAHADAAADAVGREASGLIAAATSAPLEAQPDLTAQPMPAQKGIQ